MISKWFVFDVGCLLVRDVSVRPEHSSIHERYALVVLLVGVVGGHVDLVVQVLVVEHLACELDVVVSCIEPASVTMHKEKTGNTVR